MRSWTFPQSHWVISSETFSTRSLSYTCYYTLTDLWRKCTLSLMNTYFMKEQGVTHRKSKLPYFTFKTKKQPKPQKDFCFICVRTLNSNPFCNFCLQWITPNTSLLTKSEVTQGRAKMEDIFSFQAQSSSAQPHIRINWPISSVHRVVKLLHRFYWLLHYCLVLQVFLEFKKIIE